MDYRHDHVEAALYMWEAVLAILSTPPAALSPDAKAVVQFAADYGTHNTRHAIIALAPACSDEWRALTDDERNKFRVYDWSWCPHFILTRIDWTQWQGEFGLALKPVKA